MIFNEDYISNIKIKHVWTCIFVSISLNYADDRLFMSQGVFVPFAFNTKYLLKNVLIAIDELSVTGT